MTSEFRIEHDTMGEVRVPARRPVPRTDAAGSRELPDLRQPPRTRPHRGARPDQEGRRPRQRRAGRARQDVADAIAAAADEVAAGEYDGDFPIDVYQTGSGTSSNMNTNEVLATLATRRARARRAPERPRQRVAVVQRRVPDLRARGRHGRRRPRPHPGAGHLAESLEAKSVEWAQVVKSGRTHLMDATPVTLGQEFGGYAAAVRYGIERLESALPRAAEVPLGGTAVGTGINTPAGFPQRVIELLREDTGPAADRGARPLRGAELARRPGRAVRRAAHHRGQPHEDLQRPALDGLRPQHRPRRDRDPRPAAGLLDHARQGQPGHPRGRAHGRRAGHRQRRHRRVGRRERLVRAERADPRHRRRACSSPCACWPTRRGCSPTRRSTASPPTWSAPAPWPSRRRRSSRR